MSGRVQFAMYCNSPMSLAYELLLFGSLSSGLGTSWTWGSIGIATGLASAIPSFFNRFSMYFCWDIITVSFLNVISMPTIFLGCPMSVVSHSDLIAFFMWSIIICDDVKSIKSSTQMVIIATSFLSHLTYSHGSEIKRLYPWVLIFMSNSQFHSRPDCFKLYNVLINRHTRSVPSSHPSGCFMYTVSFRMLFRYAPLMSIC